METRDLDSYYPGYDDYCDRVERENKEYEEREEKELEEIDIAYEKEIEKRLEKDENN